MCIYILVMCMYVLVCDTVLNACTGERGVQTHIQATVYYKTFKNICNVNICRIGGNTKKRRKNKHL